MKFQVLCRDADEEIPVLRELSECPHGFAIQLPFVGARHLMAPPRRNAGAVTDAGDLTVAGFAEDQRNLSQRFAQSRGTPDPEEALFANPVAGLGGDAG